MTMIPTSLAEQLKTAVSSWGTLPTPLWQELITIFRIRQVASRNYMTLPGNEAHELIFVCEGLLRFYYTNTDGKETNKAFVAEGEFAGPLASAALGLPLYFGIQALESTTMLVAPFTEFTALYGRHQAFERIGRKLAESLLIRKELRMRSLLEQTAQERYLDFVQKHPHLTGRIPQYQLAAYLGIAEVSLSRLKKNLKAIS